MNLLYDRITRFFLHAADPYSTTDLPPKTTVWAYIASHMEPLRRVLIASVVVTIFAAGVEVWLIRYAGLLVDKLTSSDTGTFWAEEGTGLALAALVVLIIRPVSQFLRLQSVGWFQEDLSGRTSTRLVEIGNNVADTFHKSLNAVGFGLVYMIGVVALMAGVEIWLALPLLIWLALYIGVLVWVIPRMITAQHRFQSAKSALVGTVVDGFSNFDTLKLFAPKNQIANELHGRLEDTRQALFRTRQIGVGLRATLVALEAVVMVGFIGYGIWLWSLGVATIGTISAAIALSIRITTMADFILDSLWWTFLRVGSLREALETVAQPIAGSIKIDGQDIRDVDQDSLRAAIGMVTQQAALLNRSVKDNILLGRSDVTETALINATKEAQAYEFIQSLRDSKGRRDFEAHVGERGVKLSGGQRQRVAIARVILKNAPILILDEATSALDSQVEAEIQKSLIGVMENKTVIAIAHRLSTIARMDRIVVLDDGKIVEEGTHEELIARSGEYAGFWGRQSRGFIDADGAAPVHG